MDIWAWVERVGEDLRASGRHRLAELMEIVPSLMVDNEHERLDAVMPEALALAREAKLPWVEVFLRHWRLQSCVLQRYKVREYLTEAVSLIEFASREETRECPQSVCATQDLANCYAHLDGPGYVKERLLVADETLRRITPDWPCFSCISGEYATALIDAGDAEGALSFIARQKAELVAAGQAASRDDMCGAEIEALLLLGRVEEALALNDRVENLPRGDSFVEFRQLDRARILARLGRFEEARRHLLPYERVVKTQSQYEPWVDAIERLVLGGAMPNDWRIGRDIARLRRTLASNGVIRRAIHLAHVEAKLALARGRVATAERVAADIAELIPELRAPLGAPEALRALEATIAEAKARSTVPGERPSVPPDGDDGEDEEEDPEGVLEAEARAGETPDTLRGLRVAAALLALGERARAEAQLRREQARAPEDPDVVRALAELLARHRGAAALDDFAEELFARRPLPEIEVELRFVLALRDEGHGERARARVHTARILELDPKNPPATVLLAELERHDGALEPALARLDALVGEAQDPALEPGPWDWERMLLGTLLERWASVRDSARRVGFTFAGEGPIEVEGELCRIEFFEDGNASPAQYYAIRTGPVTARIVEIAPPDVAQHFDDRIVFDPEPRNGPPASGEEHTHTWLYRLVRVVRAGGYRSFAIDGFHPGVEGVEALRRAALSAGARLEVRSDGSYEIEDEHSGDVRTGLYAFLAAPASGSLVPLRDALHEVASTFEHPLIWPALADAAGDATEVERHQTIAQRYRLF